MEKRMRRCPFCGGKPAIIKNTYGHYKVVCSECGASSSDKFDWDADFAVNHWNGKHFKQDEKD